MNRLDKYCACCQQRYAPKGNYSKYCSAKCRERQKANRFSEFYQANKEAVLEKNRIWFANNADKRKLSYAAWHANNTDRVKAYSKRYWEKNKEKAVTKRERQKLREWGLTKQEYDALLETQHGLCAICKETCSSGRRLAIDHDHVTGKIRGLLCIKCNNALGGFRDSSDILQSAERYLTRAASADLQLTGVLG